MPETWAERWLGTRRCRTWGLEGRRLALALGLAALFGVALGLRHGGASIALMALGAPAGILAVALVAVPAFAVILALTNAPLDVLDLASATTRASGRAGLLLAGIAPGAALLVVTCEDAITVTVMGFGVLLLAGFIAAEGFSRDVRGHVASAPRTQRALLSVALSAFLVFAAVLAARVWWLALPSLTVAS
jgi:hypothetical protein